MNGELPPRNVQREAILQQIKSPLSRQIVNTGIPNDQVRVYAKNFALPDYQMGPVDTFGELVRKEGGNAYKYIFAVAASATNPEQLANAFGALRAIEYYYEFVDRSIAPVVSKAQMEFLQSLHDTPLHLSDKASSLKAELVSLWNKGNYDKQPERFVADELNRVYAENGREFDRTAKYWVEAYLHMVLDSETPFGLRMGLLSKPGYLSYGTTTYLNKRFDRSASFWTSVDASWVYPELFGRGGTRSHTDSRDWELAGLRDRVRKLESELETGRTRATQTADYTTAQSELRELAERMRAIIDDAKVKIDLYRQIGGHPLDLLNIPWGGWKNATNAQRQEMIKAKYRELAKKYHYQVPKTDPNYDPEKAELKNGEFTKVTSAKDFLAEHLDESEF